MHSAQGGRGLLLTKKPAARQADAGYKLGATYLWACATRRVDEHLGGSEPCGSMPKRALGELRLFRSRRPRHDSSLIPRSLFFYINAYSPGDLFYILRDLEL